MNKPTRSLWPISIIVFFAVAITFLASYAVWATRQHDDLVATDYYDREVQFQSQLDSMQRSQAVAARSVVTFEPTQQVIVITLPEAQKPGVSGRVHLYRPSDSRLDRELPLALGPEGIQRLDTKQMLHGLWKVRVSWVLNGEAYFLDQRVVVTAG